METNILNNLISANRLLQKKQFMEAISYYELVLNDADELLPFIYTSIATCYYRLHYETCENSYLNSALECAKKAIELDNENIDAHIILLSIYMDELLDYTKATEEIRHCLKINPNNIAVLQMAVTIITYPEISISYQEGIEWYMRLISLRGKAADLYNLGKLYHRIGDIENCKKTWERLLCSPQKIDEKIIEIVKNHLMDL